MAALLVGEGADGRDDRRGAAGEHLGDGAVDETGVDLGDVDGPLDRFEAGLGGQGEKGVAGNAGQDVAVERRGEQLAGPRHDADVHAAQLLEPAVLGVVDEHDLVAAPVVGQLLGQEAGGVVAAALRLAGASVGDTAVMRLDPDVDRGDAAGEVGADRGGDDRVAHAPGRPDPQEGLARDGEGAQVEALLVAGGHPAGIDGDELAHGVHEVLDGELGQRQARARVGEAPGVALGTEQPDRAVGAVVGLEALEDLLGVVEDGAGRRQRVVGEGLDPGVDPAPLGVPVDGGHVVGEVDAEPGILVDPRDVLLARGSGLELGAERECHASRLARAGAGPAAGSSDDCRGGGPLRRPHRRIRPGVIAPILRRRTRDRRPGRPMRPAPPRGRWPLVWGP